MKLLLIALVALFAIGCQDKLVREVSCHKEEVGQKRDYPDRFKRWDIRDFHSKDYVEECTVTEYDWE